jgi:competence protein ComEA
MRRFRALGLLIAALSVGTLARSQWPEEEKVSSQKNRPTEVAVRALVAGSTLDINRATAADLELLPGIGPALARRIVEDRDRTGPFRTIDEVDRVRGIGPRTLERLRPFLRIETASEP